MKRPLSVVALAALAILPFMVSGAGTRAADAATPFIMASETYYRMDVPNGTASVTVEAQIQNTSSKDLAEVTFWTLPVTQDVLVTQDGNTLAHTVTTMTDGSGAAISVVKATLTKPIRPRVKLDRLKLTYTAPPQTSTNVTFQPGAVESLLVSQGPGSFVLIDTPKSAQTYHDPGCLLASDQGGAGADGMERWVCGEATLIALAADEPSVQKQCAAMADKCRQRLLEGPYSAFAQSITDASLLGKLEATVAMMNGDVALELSYFRTDASWAQSQFELAKRALPALEQLFGFAYPHPRIHLLQSHHIEVIGAAGIAFPSIGQVLVTPGTGIDEFVTVHELAHQWAGFNLEHKSSWEGLAEWAAHQLSGPLGFEPDRYFMSWSSYPYANEPMVSWDEYRPGFSSDFWYAKSGAFYSAYETAIGGRENMTKVLAQVLAEPEPARDHRWFMDRGEEVSGANLDELFLTWVFYKDTASPLIIERRAAHTAVAGLTARAAALGLSGTPKDVKTDLDNWTFNGINGRISEADAVLTAYGSLLAFAAESGYEVPGLVRDAWATKPLREVLGTVSEIRQAIEAMNTAAAQLSADAVGQSALAQAREAFAAGKMDEAKKLAARSATMRFNVETADALISVALKSQAEFEPSLFTRIGMWGKDPATDLAAAQTAMAEGRPEDAILLAKSAYKSYEEASKTGMARLAMAFGLLAAIAVGTWWLLKKLDTSKPDPDAIRRKLAGGHVLQPAEERKQGWKDWDNAP